MRLALRALILSCALIAGGAMAQQGRPVVIVVPYAAGGIVDTIARVVGADASKALGVPVIVENKPGASGAVGAAYVAKSNPDGSMLLMASNSTMINKWTYKDLPYDPERDFVGVAQAGSVTYVLVTHPSLPVNSVADLLKHAKANPASLNYASFGKGSLAHLAGELLKMSGGVDVVHVPYNGSPAALRDLIAGRVQFMFDPVTTALPPVKGNQLKALAVASTTRSPLLPDVPTVAESGIKGFEVAPWYGFVAPTGTPREAIGRLHAAIASALKTPEVAERLQRAGITPANKTPEEFGVVMATESKKWKPVIDKAGLAAK